MNEFYVEPDFRSRLNGADSFDEILHSHGEVVRHVATRRTSRIERAGKRYFIKAHFGIGWGEIFKNLVTAKAPVLGAMNEVEAIRRVAQLGISVPRIVAYGSRGANPARIESFLVTEDLGDTITLEVLSKNWAHEPPPPRFKRRLIEEVARIARQMHVNGINHRDFYICHFRKPNDPADERLYVMDLHRAQMRRTVPHRWLVKDLAGLYFSSMDIGLTSRDRFRFLRTYRNRPLREILTNEDPFWRQVVRRAHRAHAKFVRSQPSPVIGRK